MKTRRSRITLELEIEMDEPALPFQVAVHYRKEDLHKKIDGIQEDGEQE